jgi:small-conductance mechanosensitive channel
MAFPFLPHAPHFSFLNNSLDDWAAAVTVAVLSICAMAFARAFVMGRMRRQGGRPDNGRLDRFVVTMLSRTYVLFLVVYGCYLGSNFLELTRKQDLFVSRAAVAAVLIQLAVWGDTGLRAWRDQYRFGPLADLERRASSSVVCFLLRLTLWVVASLMLLDNFNINITTLVASLGIGGVAVALATQNILGDLFASLSIMLDKPFEVGDFIIVGDVLGSVEHIGLKTTRLRGLGGEQVVFSNGDLLKSRIHNHKRMETRRVAFVLRISYGTGEETLCRIPGIIRDVIAARSDVDFERAHFFMWGEWSLDFEVVYHFRSPDYIKHMDAQQAIFLELYRRFEQDGIGFAHPLSIVRLADQDRAALGRPPTPPAPAPGTPFH